LCRRTSTLHALASTPRRVLLALTLLLTMLATHAAITGSGNAGKTPAASIAGSGDVEYACAAAITRSRIAGSGRVRQRP
jgi:hypothetical protein